jgi:putative membrane protein
MVVPPAITAAEHALLLRAIQAAEAKTTGEIYVVVAHSADEFRLVPVLWAALVALVFPWILRFTTNVGFTTILLLQVLVFVTTAAVISVAKLRYRVVPHGIAADAVHRAALAQFMAHGVHLDRNRNAILIYVCMLPRHIEVVAGEGIHARVGEAKWQQMVAQIAAEAQSGRLVEGLSSAIRSAGEFLAAEFPASGTRHRMRGDVVET